MVEYTEPALDRAPVGHESRTRQRALFWLTHDLFEPWIIFG